MKEKPGWLNTLATVAISLGLIGASWWTWDRCNYSIPSFLNPSYDPFATPSEMNSLQLLVGTLSAARSQRIDRKIERRTRRRIEAEAIQGFREFQLAGNRFYFSYYPADDSDGASGEFSLSEYSEIENLEVDEGGGSQPLSNGVRMVRSGKKTLVLESASHHSEWKIESFRGRWEPSTLPVPPSPFSSPHVPSPAFPITPPVFGPECCFRDDYGNELVFSEWVDFSKSTESEAATAESP